MTDIVVILACSLCGFAIGKFLERLICGKAAFFSDVNRYLTLFVVNIDGRQLEIDAFNKDFKTSCGSAFAEYLDGGKMRLKLSQSEKKELKSFFDDLSAVSSQDLKKQIECHKAFFAVREKIYSEQASKASVYSKLGILLGVMVGIVLV